MSAPPLPRETRISQPDLVATLAALRRERGLTQLEMSIRMGISQSSLSGFEVHVGDPRLSTVERYCAALGLRMEVVVIEDTVEAEPDLGEDPAGDADPR